MTEYYLDTSGWFAALSPREPKHRAALDAYRGWIEAGDRLVTTNLVVAEMQILLSRFRGPAEGLRFLDSLYQDPAHEVVFVDRPLERDAVDRWLRRLGDQAISLADAVSRGDAGSPDHPRVGAGPAFRGRWVHHPPLKGTVQA